MAKNARTKYRHNMMCQQEIKPSCFSTLVPSTEISNSIVILMVLRLCFWIFSFFDFKTQSCQRQFEPTLPLPHSDLHHSGLSTLISLFLLGLSSMDIKKLFVLRLFPVFCFDLWKLYLLTLIPFEYEVK